MPILHNYHTQGKQWKLLDVSSQQVLERSKKIMPGSKELFEYIEELIEDAVRKEYIRK